MNAGNLDLEDLHDCLNDDQPKENCLSFLNDTVAESIYNLTSSDAHYCIHDGWIELRMEELKQRKYFRDSTCPPDYDGWSCWPAIGFNSTIEVQCPLGYNQAENATKYCNANGIWEKSNYEMCLTDEMRRVLECSMQQEKGQFDITACNPDHLTEDLSFIMRDIYFYGSIFSLALLFIAFVIFCSFKSLQCPRVHIHKNLLLSLMLQCILNIVIFEPYISLDHTPTGSRNYNHVPWLCKTIFTLSNLTFMTNIYWALVEGLFLYSRISIAVFSTNTPYWLLYSLGWGIPIVFTGSWAACMHFYSPEQDCWKGFGGDKHFWIVVAPILLAALINLLLLICIIKILVTKLHAVHSAEHVQIRKAMKATIVLLPLLSITSLFFVMSPSKEKNPQAYFAYRIVNTTFQVSQGIFVSVLFCFCNGEVRSAVTKYYRRWRSEPLRYRTSRASSVCVTQSEMIPEVDLIDTLLFSNSDGLDAANYKHLMVSNGGGGRRSSQEPSSTAVVAV